MVFTEDLLENSEGLIITSACIASEINKKIQNDKIPEAKELVKAFKEKLGDDFYVEFQTHKIVENIKCMKEIVKIADELGIKIVFATDTHYPNKEDKQFHDALLAISRKSLYGQESYDDDCLDRKSVV